MLFLNLGKWNSAHGRFLSCWRYYNQGKWTPLIKVTFRYLRTMEPRSSDQKELSGVGSLHDINCDSTEGKLLITTLARLSGQPGYSAKHPDETLREMVEVAKEFK